MLYMFCNVVLYCIALPARVLFAIKDYYIMKQIRIKCFPYYSI